MKKCCLFLLLAAILVAPVGCSDRESAIEVYPYLQPSVDKTGLAVNISTHKIHIDTECRHVKNSKEDNLRYTEHTTENVNTLFSMGYTLCQDCSE